MVALLRFCAAVGIAACIFVVGEGRAAENQALVALEKRIRAGEIPNVHSVIVVHKGKTLAEWYFEGPDERRGQPLGYVKFGPETIHDVRSVTKSIVSILFGIAQGQGAIKGLDTPVLDYFPEYKDLQTAERRRITLGHLLSMTSGLHWDEDTHPYTDPRNSETAMDLAADRLRFVLEQKIDAQPGARFRYSGGDVALIGAIIARATKMPLEAFAGQALFAPLGITNVEWLKDDKGVPYAASGLRMLPRDMAKIGLLMLNNGKHGEAQVVPEMWAKASVTPHSVVEVEPGCGFHYGYFWWLYVRCEKSSDPGFFTAIGNGGQRIFVVPERKLVIVVTAGLYNDPRQRTIRQITQAVIAATAGE
jgi:CubicO group peptidase (beta-lactamase class C family)